MRSLRTWSACLALLLPLLMAVAPAYPQDAATGELPTADASGTDASAEKSAEAEPEEAAPPRPEASQLAQRLEETSSKLRKLHSVLGEDKTADEVQKTFPPLRKRLEELDERQDDLLEPATGRKALNDLENEWKDAAAQLAGWTNALTVSAAKLDDIRTQLRKLSQEWMLVRERSQEAELPSAVIQRVETTLVELSATENEVRTRRARVLELQNSLSEELVDVGSVLDLVDQARKKEQEQLLESERPPLWKILANFSLNTPVWRQIAESWIGDARAVKTYATDHPEPFGWQFLLLLTLAGLVGSLDRQSRRTSFQDPELAAAARVLRRPFSAAVLITLLATPWIHPVAPSGLQQFSGLALIPAVLRLLPKEFRERRDGSLASAVLLYLLSAFSGQIDPASDVNRIFILVESCAGLFILLNFFKPDPKAQASSIWSLLLRIGRRLIIAGLTVAVFANIIGNASLADLFTSSFLNAGFVAVMLYAVSRVLDGVMIMLPRTGALGSIDIVHRNAQMFARRGIGLVRVITWCVWFGFTLRFFQIRDEFAAGFQETMTASWQLGSLEISAGNIIVFIVAIMITIASARSLQFILRHDVLPKLNLPRGVPGAIASATQYVTLSLGFVISLAVAGVDLGSLALVAGGLGVGIGFGLQNVVNNFVSGLILLFERPVRDGDFVEAGTTFGEVKRIGFRSSTIRTWQGSEVIVPNADLISQTVTNWTLTDNHRCMELPVRAAYGNEAEKIMKLLIETAAIHENTFEDPGPKVYFMAFGENALEFSLRFWVNFEVGFGTRSEVAVLVDNALREAGFAAPVPHRVIHLETQSS
ncbi:MAG: mechanosensitive ion channel [Candidatus Binatia bacterium]|nr:mechanosensitive ion channel [Candidatus Binatia bacterium]